MATLQRPKLLLLDEHTAALDPKTCLLYTSGLTEKGIEFVQEMERLGMIIDISHLNDAGIWDVFRYTKRPFVASHSLSLIHI